MVKPKYDSQEEWQLILKSRDGDRDSFEILIHRYYPQIFKMLLQLLYKPQDAEDLAQDAFLEAYRCLKNFKGESKFYTWLYRIATNLTMNHIRKTRSTVSVDESLEALTQMQNSSPTQNMEWSEFHQSFLQSLGELSDEKRVVFILREMHNLSYQEIAEVVDIKIGTVMSRLARAREELRASLEPYGKNTSPPSH